MPKATQLVRWRRRLGEQVVAPYVEGVGQLEEGTLARVLSGSVILEALAGAEWGRKPLLSD